MGAATEAGRNRLHRMDRGRSPSRPARYAGGNHVASAKPAYLAGRPKSNGLGEGTGKEPRTLTEHQRIDGLGPAGSRDGAFPTPTTTPTPGTTAGSLVTEPQ